MPKPNQRMSQQRTLCANCNICVNTLRRFVVVELDSKVISLLSERITPLLINEEDVICEACWVILEQEVDEKLAHDNSGKKGGPSNRGHRQVCIICGLSLLRRQSDRILRRNPTDLERAIINVIKSRILPRQITPSDCVCHPCWLRSRRSAQRSVAVQDHIKKERVNEPKPSEQELQRARSRSPVDPETPDQEIQWAIHIKEERVDESKPLEQEIQRARSRSPVEPETPEQGIQHSRSRCPVDPILTEPEIGKLTLPNYKRAANTASHCLYPGCENEHLRTITDNLRATVLSNYHFYIPILARVCVEHLHCNDWDSLYNLPSSINYFTAKQIEHVFSFVKTSKCRFNFNSVEAIQEIDDGIFFHWIGRTKEDFASILQEVPRIQEVHRGVLGLAAFLMKMTTGESDDRMSTLLEVPRRTLERLMNSVRDILLQDFVPRNLGTCKFRKIVGAQSITRFCAKKSKNM